MKVHAPKFLTKELADVAVNVAIKTAFEQLPVKREHAHVVILVPALTIDESKKYPQKYGQEMILLYEESFGNKEEWEHEYDEIAQCKALQVADGSNLSGSQLETPAHLLYSGDTPYWGADELEGIVVACSGVQPWFDKAISRMVATILIALAKEEWENSEDKKQGSDFLS